MKKIEISTIEHKRYFIEEEEVELYGINPEVSQIIGSAHGHQIVEDGKLGTFRTATVFVSGKKAYIHDLSIINDSSDSLIDGQSIALYADSEEMLVENCHIISRQDTLFISPLPEKERIEGGFKGPREHSERIPTRQTYRHCLIVGDVDFIFGGGEAVFEDCDIVSLGSDREVGYVAAPSTPEGEKGFTFTGCRFISQGCADESVYLARPWREYGQAVFKDCQFGSHIKKEYFSGWNRDYKLEENARFQVIQKGNYMKNTAIDNYIDQYMANFHPYKDGRWCYEDGILMTALYDMYKATGEQKYFDFVDNYYDSMINEDGTIVKYSVNEYNIDNLCSGMGLILLYQDKPLKKYEEALKLLRVQVANHPRTSEGSFFHKAIYPNQIWMDGIYMGLVFYAMYGKQFDEPANFEDIDHQLHTLDNRLFDPEKGLYMHAFDETKSMQWADPQTGRSPHCWSRACGWVSMAMNDIYEVQPLEICKTVFTRLVESVKPYLKDGMLQQVVEVDQEPNYQETSGSAMLAYGLLKAGKSGIYDGKELGNEVFDSIVRNKFDGEHLNGICKVAGLDNKKRDGSFEYYMSEEVVADEVKGVAPFIMAYALTLGE